MAAGTTMMTRENDDGYLDDLMAVTIIAGLNIIDNNKLQLSHVFSEREKLFKCFMGREPCAFPMNDHADAKTYKGICYS